MKNIEVLFCSACFGTSVDVLGWVDGNKRSFTGHLLEDDEACEHWCSEQSKPGRVQLTWCRDCESATPVRWGHTDQLEVLRGLMSGVVISKKHVDEGLLFERVKGNPRS